MARWMAKASMERLISGDQHSIESLNTVIGVIQTAVEPILFKTMDKRNESAVEFVNK